jgi:hypothetical protein
VAQKEMFAISGLNDEDVERLVGTIRAAHRRRAHHINCLF